MPRKRKTQPDNYNKAFPSAMRTLMEQKGTTQNELAEFLQKTRQSVSYYCDGSSSPDWETLVKIADYFDVSTDYLLGRTQDPRRQPCATADLGLSSTAIYNIRNLCERFSDDNDTLRKGLNALLEEESFIFFAGAVEKLSRTIKEEIKLAKVFHETSLGHPEVANPKLRHALSEDEMASHIYELVENHSPELSGKFSVLLGRHFVDQQKQYVLNYFEEILRDIVNYPQFAKYVLLPNEYPEEGD